MQSLNRSSASGYSPSIHMTLEIEGRQMHVAEVGPNYLIVENPHETKPTTGILTITVDGEDIKRVLQFPTGIESELTRQPMAVIQTMVPVSQTETG